MGKRIKAIVKKGFITRFSYEDFWEEVLEQVSPGEELVDADAVPHYMETDDGSPWPEYYGWYAPKDGPRVFCVVRATEKEKKKLENCSKDWVNLTAMIGPSGEIHATGGDREEGEGDQPFIGIERLKRRMPINSGDRKITYNITVYEDGEIFVVPANNKIQPFTPEKFKVVFVNDKGTKVEVWR